MKKGVALLVIVIAILLGAVSYYYSQRLSIYSTQHKPQITPAVTPSISMVPSPTSAVSFCTPENVQAAITIGAGAGNIYGTVTLKNTSAHPCEVLGNEFVAANYDTSTVKNIMVTHVGQTQSQPFMLSPNQTIYSQVHYPNGPQCQSIGINPVHVSFTYKISPVDTVTFKNQNGSTEQIVQACTSASDTTEIEIWNMSSQPITP